MCVYCSSLPPVPPDWMDSQPHLGEWEDDSGTLAAGWMGQQDGRAKGGRLATPGTPGSGQWGGPHDGWGAKKVKRRTLYVACSLRCTDVCVCLCVCYECKSSPTTKGFGCGHRVLPHYRHSGGEASSLIDTYTCTLPGRTVP